MKPCGCINLKQEGDKIAPAGISSIGKRTITFLKTSSPDIVEEVKRTEFVQINRCSIEATE